MEWFAVTCDALHDVLKEFFYTGYKEGRAKKKGCEKAYEEMYKEFLEKITKDEK